MNQDREEMLLDLLMKKAVHGLTETEVKRLSELEAGREHDASFDLTASAVALVDVEPEPIPANLRSRVLADAERYFDEATTSPQESIANEGVRSPSEKMPIWGWLGWAVAAAAIILLVANVWIMPTKKPDVVRVPTPTPAESLDPAQQRQRLLDSNSVNARAEWTTGNVKELAVSGDIVWSDEKQAGYMRFKGLPVNDTSRQTYQLWIFDETQDPKTPIDGGTFDVNADGEVVIPVNARLKAKNPKMFAVTIEKPGGVVVSKQEKVAAIAKVAV
jgi:anti-sigma-K factor RskA